MASRVVQHVLFFMRVCVSSIARIGVCSGMSQLYALSYKLPVPQVRCQIFRRGIIARALIAVQMHTRKKDIDFDVSARIESIKTQKKKC